MRENRSSGFPTRSDKTDLYSHISRQEACNFGFNKKRDCTIRVAKIKALISFAGTAKRSASQLLRSGSAPLFLHRQEIRFSHNAAQMSHVDAKPF